jgi:hypothetical protein
MAHAFLNFCVAALFCPHVCECLDENLYLLQSVPDPDGQVGHGLGLNHLFFALLKPYHVLHGMNRYRLADGGYGADCPCRSP